MSNNPNYFICMLCWLHCLIVCPRYRDSLCVSFILVLWMCSIVFLHVASIFEMTVTNFAPNFISSSYITVCVCLSCIKRSQMQGGPLLNIALHFNFGECFTISLVYQNASLTSHVHVFLSPPHCSQCGNDTMTWALPLCRPSCLLNRGCLISACLHSFLPSEGKAALQYKTAF